MKKQKINERGITLIALVITIIVLLILAGVTLNILINSGILSNSQKAVDIYKEQQAKEKLDMAITDYQLSQLSPETKGKTFEKAVEEVGGKATHNDETKEYEVEIDGLTFKVSDETLGKKEEEEKTPKIEDGNNIGGTENGTLTGEKPSYKNPVIPVGFKTKETPDASWEIAEDGKTLKNWDKGLVITDDENDGNEFVWVPAYVDEIDGKSISEKEKEEYEKNKVPKYEKWLGSKNVSEITQITDVSNDTLPMLDSDNNDDIQAYEEKQIGKYGGFYIGRYEAGTTLDYDDRDKVETPLVKQYQKPWNHISYYNAKKSAESMYKTNAVQSVLVTGTMWDTTLTWLIQSGLLTKEQVEENSSTWGNYYDVVVTEVSGYYNNYKMEDLQWVPAKSTLANKNCVLKTGESERTKKKNIYDLAGNMYEWTNEIYSSNYVLRAGYFGNFASGFPVAYRTYGNASGTYDISGSFRVGLYIK